MFEFANIKKRVWPFNKIDQLEKELKYYKNLKEVSENKLNIASGEFWDSLYYKGGNSGAGSYSRLADFKAEIINDFLKINDIKTAIEFGCGDGNQFRLINYPFYTGIDASEFIIGEHKKRYKGNDKKNFFHLSERENYINLKYDVSLSLDVIFHLLEEHVFASYMEDLFFVANKYVIIYSSNHEEFTKWPEYRHRKFIKFIQDHIGGWRIKEFIPNRYPYIIGEEKDTSAADFYIFEKTVN